MSGSQGTPLFELPECPIQEDGATTGLFDCERGDQDTFAQTLDVDRQRRYTSAEAVRSDAERVDLAQEFRFELGRFREEMRHEPEMKEMDLAALITRMVRDLNQIYGNRVSVEGPARLNGALLGQMPATHTGMRGCTGFGRKCADLIW